MHGTIMVFFVLTTAPQGGFGNYFLPIQIGAPDMAFPVLNMLSFWTTFVGFIVILCAFFVTGGAPLHGWTGYPPLSALPSAGPGEAPGRFVDHQHRDLLRASLMGALNFITTTLDLRAKGMTLMRMPLTCWTWFMTAILGLLAFAVLLSAGILLLWIATSVPASMSPRVVVNGQIIGAQGRIATAMAAPVLVLRASRGLHRDPAGMGVASQIALDVLAQADLRISRDGVRDAGHRILRLHGLGPPHVHERHESLFGDGILHADHVYRGALGDQDIQLAGHDVEGQDPLPHARCCSPSASCRCLFRAG